MYPQSVSFDRKGGSLSSEQASCFWGEGLPGGPHPPRMVSRCPSQAELLSPLKHLPPTPNPFPGCGLGAPNQRLFIIFGPEPGGTSDLLIVYSSLGGVGFSGQGTHQLRRSSPIHSKYVLGTYCQEQLQGLRQSYGQAQPVSTLLKLRDCSVGIKALPALAGDVLGFSVERGCAD